MTEQNHKLYRLRVIDKTGTAFVIIGSKNDIGGSIDWLESGVGMWLRLSGFDDEADRRPIQIIIAREDIAGMLLTRV